MKNTIREKLISAGVKNLGEYGYPSCNAENILTDEIYSAFFLSMLKGNFGHGFDREIKELITEIEGNQK